LRQASTRSVRLECCSEASSWEMAVSKALQDM
jgi:hypothetical protein